MKDYDKSLIKTEDYFFYFEIIFKNYHYEKFLLAMFIFTLTYHIGFSQITFVKEYAIPGALSNGVSIVEDIAGGYIFTGFSYDSLSDQTYQYVAKCDPWEVSIGLNIMIL